VAAARGNDHSPSEIYENAWQARPADVRCPPVTLRSWGALVAGWLLVWAAPAAAVDTVITFDEGVVAPGASLTNQYEDKGVVFGEWFVKREASNRVVRATVASEHSGTRAAVHDNRGGSQEFPCSDGDQNVRSSSVFGEMLNWVDRITVFAGFDYTAATWPVELRVYDQNLEYLGGDTKNAIGGSIGRQLSVTTAGSKIAYFEVRHDGDCVPLAIDDLTFPQESNAPPAFSLVHEPQSPSRNGLLDPGTIGLRPGASDQSTIKIRRFNHSSGNLSFSVVGPAPPVTVTFGATTTSAPTNSLKVTANDDAGFFSGTLVIRATGPASAGPPKDLKIPLLIAPHYLVDDASAALGSGCTSRVKVPLRVPNTLLGPPNGPGEPGGILERTFSGQVGLTVGTPSAGGVQASFTPASVALSNAALLAELRVTTDAGSSGTRTIPVSANAGPYRADPATVTVDIQPASVSFSPTSGTAPVGLQPGTEVTIHTTGLCNPLGHEAPFVVFGTETLGDLNPAQFGAPATGPDASGDFHVRVPRKALSGKVSIGYLGGNRIESAGTFAVSSFRSTQYPQFHNEAPSAYHSDDVQKLFGTNQTDIQVDPCDSIPVEVAEEVYGWFTGEDEETDCALVSTPGPLTYAMVGLLNEYVATPGGGGVCFGIGTTSERIRHGLPLGSLLGAPVGVSAYHDVPDVAASRYYLKIHQAGVMSSEMIGAIVRNWSGELNPFVSNPTKELRDLLVKRLAAGDRPLISMKTGAKAHVVTAYDIEDFDTGFYIHVADPNQEFNKAEAENLAIHDARIDNQRIVVQNDFKWFYTGGTYGGTLDDRAANWFMVLPRGLVPLQPTMPTSANGLVTIFKTALAGGAALAGRGPVAAASARAAAVAPGAGSVPFAIPEPNAPPVDGSITPSGPATHTITGTNNGTYSGVVVGRGMAVRLARTHIARGATDRVTVDASDASVGFETRGAAKPIDLQLTARGPKGATHTAHITLRTARGGSDTLALGRNRRSLVLRHMGAPTTAVVELSSADRGSMPAAFRSGPIALAAGATLTVTPGDWSRLGRTPLRAILKPRTGRARRLTLRDRTKRGRARITGLKVTVRRAKRGVRVTIAPKLRTPKRLPVGSTLILAERIVRGRRVIAGREVQLTGAALRRLRTTPWTAKVPRAARYRVVVLARLILGGGPVLRSESRAFDRTVRAGP
jgi:hypothetical protein